MQRISQVKKIETIRKPIEPNGQVLLDKSKIETFEFGQKELIAREGGKKAVPCLVIQIAQHDDGLWMWATSYFFKYSSHGYQVGAKWGKFSNTRQEAITAATQELLFEHKEFPKGGVDWLIELGHNLPVQTDLFN